MIKQIKNNKVLAILLVGTILSFLIGILLPSILNDATKEEITNNIIVLKSQVKTNAITNKNVIKMTFTNNLFWISIIWMLGISIIGIPIILLIYSGKVIVVALELTSFLLNLKQIKLLFIPIYLLPSILNTLIYFVLVYYALNFSYLLIKLLFFKKQYNIAAITKRYLKILGFCILLTLISSGIESWIIPKLLIHFL